MFERESSLKSLSFSSIGTEKKKGKTWAAFYFVEFHSLLIDAFLRCGKEFVGAFEYQ